MFQFDGRLWPFLAIYLLRTHLYYFRFKIWRQIWELRARFLEKRENLAITRCLGQFLLNRLLRMCKTGLSSTSGQIFNCKFEIPVVRVLFAYKIWWHLRVDLCVFGAKTTAFVMQNCQILEARGEGYPFLVKTPKGTSLADSARFESFVV